MISENLKKIRDHVVSVCQQIGRDPKEIVIVGASKYTDATHIQEAVAAGLTHIGENRVQDAAKKFQELDVKGVHVQRHMIGHLQSNKAKAAVEMFDLIQSVDSIKIARELDKQCGHFNKTQNILVQINTSREEQKSGIPVENALDTIAVVAQLPRLNIQGLMTMAMVSVDEHLVRECFSDLRKIFEKARQQLAGHPRVQMRYLSMGMSGDYELAIKEGANMIRIGRAIFND